MTEEMQRLLEMVDDQGPDPDFLAQIRQEMLDAASMPQRSSALLGSTRTVTGPRSADERLRPDDRRIVVEWTEGDEGQVGQRFRWRTALAVAAALLLLVGGGWLFTRQSDTQGGDELATATPHPTPEISAPLTEQQTLAALLGAAQGTDSAEERVLLAAEAVALEPSVETFAELGAALATEPRNNTIATGELRGPSVVMFAPSGNKLALSTDDVDGSHITVVDLENGISIETVAEPIAEGAQLGFPWWNTYFFLDENVLASVASVTNGLEVTEGGLIGPVTNTLVPTGPGWVTPVLAESARPLGYISVDGSQLIVVNDVGDETFGATLPTGFGGWKMSPDHSVLLAIQPEGAQRPERLQVLELPNTVFMPDHPIAATGADAAAKVSFSPNTDLVAAGTGNRLEILRMGSWEQVTSLDLPGELAAVSFMGNERVVTATQVDGSNGYELTLWDLGTQTVIYQLELGDLSGPLDSGRLASLFAASTKASRIAILLDPNGAQVSVLDLDTDNWVELACQSTTYRLTDAERAEFGLTDQPRPCG